MARRHYKLSESFSFAFSGLAFFFRTQRNARIHLVLGLAACAGAAWLRITRLEWLMLIYAIVSVMSLEGINTAIETVVDLASPDIHPLAKQAKDLAAAMVLLASFAATVIGLVILGPPLWSKLLG